MNIKIKERIDCIADELMEDYLMMNDIGLTYGRMGIVIFFFHYAKLTDKKEYEDIAMEIISSIRNVINAQTSITYDDGLSGIGFAISYLMRNGFIEDNRDQILLDFDNLIISKVILSDERDIHFLNSLPLIGKYYLERLRDRIITYDDVIGLINKQNIIYIVDILDNNKNVISEKGLLLKFIIEIYSKKICVEQVISLLHFLIEDYDKRFEDILENIKNNNFDSQQHVLSPLQRNSFIHNGLMNGKAGEALKLITLLDCNHESWLELIN